MQSVALSWLVYRLTDSPMFLGIVAFATQAPTFVIAPFAGVLADRWNKHKIVLATQACSMLQAIVLTSLVLTRMITPWQIVALSAILGIINGFDIPTRQAFINELMDRKEDLPNAIALNSLIFNGARLVGPSIAGLIIWAAGEGACFLINAISYVAVLFALSMIRVDYHAAGHQNGKVLQGIREGIIYSYRFIPIRTLLLTLAYMSLIGMPYAVLLPVFARDILHGGPQTLGFLMGCVGIGALAGAIFLASRRSVRGLGKIIVLAISLFGGGLVAFSFSLNIWVSYAIMLFVGFGAMAHMASINTVLQTIVDDDKRGRVMSLYTMSFIGMAPFGSLLVGWLAGKIGATHTLQISGILCVVVAVVFARNLPQLRKRIHPIYIKKGIIPEMASGLGAASQLTLESKE